MKYNVYCVRDNKANYFWQPQIDVNNETAKRSFGMMIANSGVQSVTGFASGDFDLYQVGTFDSDTGEVVSVIPPIFVVNGNLVKEVNDEK